MEHVFSGGSLRPPPLSHVNAEFHAACDRVNLTLLSVALNSALKPARETGPLKLKNGVELYVNVKNTYLVTI